MPYDNTDAPELAETYINGNISDVRRALESLPALGAVALAMEIARYLPSRERQLFINLCVKWGER